MAKQLHKAAEAEKPGIKARILAAGNLLGILGRIPRSGCRVAYPSDVIAAERSRH